MARFSAFSAALGQLQAPAPEITVDSKWPQNVLRPLHQQGSQIGIAFLTDVHLGLALRALTGDVKDRVGCFGVLVEHIDSLRSRQQHELDLAAFGFVHHLFHHRQSAVCAGADDELATFPRDLFLY